jgi:hypothetical protein
MPFEDSRGRAPAALQWESVSVDLGSSPLFRQEGEYWTIAYDGVVFRLRDTKGMHCVAHLLRHPGEKIAATALVMAGGSSDPRPLAPLGPRNPGAGAHDRHQTHQGGGTDDRGAPRRARTSSHDVHQDRRLLRLNARPAARAALEVVMSEQGATPFRHATEAQPASTTAHCA